MDTSRDINLTEARMSRTGMLALPRLTSKIRILFWRPHGSTPKSRVRSPSVNTWWEQMGMSVQTILNSCKGFTFVL